MKLLVKSFALIAGVSALVSGCAVYQPAPVYSQQPYYSTSSSSDVYYSQPGPVYMQSAPVYVQPAPVYVEPPIRFGFNFGYWGGGGRHHHRH